MTQLPPPRTVRMPTPEPGLAQVRVLLVNGLPGSGALEIGKELHETLLRETNREAVHVQFEDILRDAALKMFADKGVRDWHLDLDKRHKALGFKSKRQVLDELRDNYGYTLGYRMVFGIGEHLASNGPATFIITDAQDEDQCKPIVEQFGKENVLLLRVTRVGLPGKLLYSTMVGGCPSMDADGDRAVDANCRRGWSDYTVTGPSDLGRFLRGE